MQRLSSVVPALIFASLSQICAQNTDTIRVDSRWEADTVRVSRPVLVADGVTLEIAPGTVVLFEGHYPLWVAGRVVARGSEDSVITFTAADTTAGWHGVRFSYTRTTNDTSYFDYCLFTYGRATGSLNWETNGGALSISFYSKVAVTNSVFRSNYAEYQGGAIYCARSSPLLRSNTITLNRAGYEGGAICCADSASPVIEYNQITHNRAATYGGAVSCLVGSRARLERNFIADNLASSSGGEGGAVYCTRCVPVLINNVILRNRAGYSGGGICLYLNTPATITGNVLARNVAGYEGGAIYMRQSNPSMANNTIALNTAGYRGAAIYFYYSSPTIVNSIIWQNNNSYDTFDSRPVVQVVYSDDPRFIDTAAGNYALDSASQCIDAGMAVAGLPPHDAAGNPRISGERVDIGAYEYQQATVSVQDEGAALSNGQSMRTRLAYRYASGVGQVLLHNGQASFTLKGRRLPNAQAKDCR